MSLPARPAGVTRELIVGAAAALFASEGFHDVGIREVAAAAGMRGPSIYHHFASKEEILYAICLTVTREPVEQQLPLLDAAGTPVSRLRALARAHVLHLTRRQVEHLVGRHELAALTPAHRAEVDDHRRYYQRRVRDTVLAGAAAGELSVQDADLATFAMLDMLNGTSSWFRPDGPVGAEALADSYAELVVGGLLGATRP